MTGSRVVEEATRRSAVVWVAVDRQPPRLVWHVWHDGRLWLVVGGLEQAVPGLLDARSAWVAVRSKEKQGDLLVEWEAAVHRVPVGSPEWDAAVPLLHAKRLNPPDGAAQPQRWARESVVLRLVPTGRERTGTDLRPGSPAARS